MLYQKMYVMIHNNIYKGAVSMKYKMMNLIAVVLLVITLLTGCSKTSANEANTSTEHSENVPTVKTVDCSVDATRGEVVVYDSEGFYVEYRGLIYDRGDFQISLYFENETGERLFSSLGNCLINRNSISLGNSAIEMVDNSTYLVGPNFNYVIDESDFEAYGNAF